MSAIAGGSEEGPPHVPSSWLVSAGVQENLVKGLTLQRTTGLVHVVAAGSTRERGDFRASWRPELGLAQLASAASVGQRKSQSGQIQGEEK